MTTYTYSEVDKSKDETMVNEDDVRNALGDIADIAPELMEYILTCYPPELMMYMSPELRKRLEQARPIDQP